LSGSYIGGSFQLTAKLGVRAYDFSLCIGDPLVAAKEAIDQARELRRAAELVKQAKTLRAEATQLQEDIKYTHQRTEELKRSLGEAHPTIKTDNTFLLDCSCYRRSLNAGARK